MIERTFGNFKGTVDPIAETVLVLGLRFGWKGLYSVDELPAKIAFYKRLIKKPQQSDRGRPAAVLKSYQETLSCLEWAARILADG